MIIRCISVGLGGCLGAVLRYLFSTLPLWQRTTFPWSTLFINFIGALVIGMVIGFAKDQVNRHEEVMLFLKVGICGGFSTFSAFSAETVSMMDSGRVGLAVLYATLSVIGCMFAVVMGKHLAL